MSIIYKSLKKLQSNSIGDERQETRFKQSRPSGLGRNVFKSPIFICLLVIIVVLIGFGLIYGFWGHNKASDDANAFEYLSSHTTKKIINSNKEDQLLNDTDSEETEYTPPDTEIADSDEEGDGHTPIQSKVKPPIPKNPPLKKVRSKKRLKLKNTESGDAIQASLKTETNTALLSGKGKAPKNKNTPMELTQQGRDRSYIIIRLVKRVHHSIKQGNDEKTERLLGKLEKLKGKNDPYILKLRSYLCMQKGKNEAAYNMLEKVINRNPKDLEAGINLAIIEIRTQRLKKAAQRLKALETVYPENTLIQDLIKKLHKSRRTIESTVTGAIN